MARLIALAWTAAAALVFWLVLGHGFVNYDTLYALVWGNDLAHGHLPDYNVPLAPTPHPLAIVVGIVLAPLGAWSSPLHDGAEPWVVVLAFLSLGAVGYLIYRLGAEWFGRAAGVLAAVIFLTRIPVLSFGVRAYVDIPYLALVLAALLLETRRPRAGAPVLVLLGLAGLIRPEAWLFSAAYLAWLWRGGAERSELVRLGALAAAAPVLWLASDWAVTGDPLHSLTGTRHTAETLKRPTGLGSVPATMPRRLGEILREPVLVGAAGGGVLALLWLRDRARLGAVAGVVAVLSFCVLAVAGLPIIGRYLLLPAAILAVFCGAGAFGWLDLPRGDPRRRWWMAFGALVLLLLVAFTPVQVKRIRSLRDNIAIQQRIRDDLRAIVATPAVVRSSCGPIAVPNHRPVPLLALWLDRRSRDIVSAQLERPTRGLYLDPANAEVERNFTLDKNDPHPLTAAVPPGFRLLERNRSWRLYGRCG